MSAALAAQLARRDWPRRKPGTLGPASEDGASPLDAAALYPRWADFLAEGDVLIAETGTASMGMGFARLPRGRASTTRLCGVRSVGRRRRQSERRSPHPKDRRY